MGQTIRDCKGSARNRGNHICAVTGATVGFSEARLSLQEVLKVSFPNIEFQDQVGLGPFRAMYVRSLSGAVKAAAGSVFSFAVCRTNARYRKAA
jgi:hypothetical protein